MNLNKQLNLVLQECESINLQKLKLDTLLIIVHHLLSDYKKMQLPKSENDMKFIHENVKNLKIYLDNNIVTSETLSYVFKNQNKSSTLKKISINLEPMRAYYKFLTSIFSSQLKKGSYWIPELLAFSLIYNYKKEFEKSFCSYTFIDSFPIEKILNIYNENNIAVKKNISQKEEIPTWKVKTSLDEMYDLSEYMIKKYLSYSFKINTKRVSKTRKKRRR
ncbi:hypothetical protein ACOJTA_05245 [Malaciobacter sp. WC5094]|uniref:hypothetical protein n=1 Tax=Arcobacter sp. YIC-80 TaxID=3376683 RepID=UPI00384EBC4A